MSSRRLSILFLLVAAASAGCGGGGGGGSPPPADPGPTAPAPPPPAQPLQPGAWLNFGRDAQHSGLSGGAPAQPLSRLHWQARVDQVPVYRIPEGGDNANLLLTAHYGSPLVTAANTVVHSVKVTTATYRIEARNATDGQLKWQSSSDYIPPASFIGFGPALAPNGRVWFPGAGGRLFFQDGVDGAAATPMQAVSFYGNAAYEANKAALDASVKINTPITVDAAGNVYFGFEATANPLGLSGGVARIGADGSTSWVAASKVADDTRIAKLQSGAAPALSRDGSTLYVAVNAFATTLGGRTFGYLAALHSATLAVRGKVLLLDPKSGKPASMSDQGTSSPVVGPDGDVYFGVLGETDSPVRHRSLGWLLHFDAALATTKTPGGFGWDTTPAIVPASAVGGYAGSSPYLLVTKYNEYAQGQHRMAVLDPNAAQADRYEPGVPVMREVITILSPSRVSASSPVLHEWCINAAAVDAATRSVFMNSSDGYLYRWDLATNTLAERFNLNTGYFQLYTPTVLGPDGRVYAINNAVLMAVGR
jgi:hypothetical protein